MLWNTHRPKSSTLSCWSTEYFPKSLEDHWGVQWRMWDGLLCSFCQQWFSPWKSPVDAIFAQFLIVESWTLSWGKWGLQSSWMSWSGVHHCSVFSPFVDNGFFCSPFQTDGCQWLCFSALLEFPWIGTRCIAFWDLFLAYLMLSDRFYWSVWQ